MIGPGRKVVDKNWLEVTYMNVTALLSRLFTFAHEAIRFCDLSFHSKWVLWNFSSLLWNFSNLLWNQTFSVNDNGQDKVKGWVRAP